MSNDDPDCDWPEELTEEAWMLDQEEKLKALSEAIAKAAAETKEIEVLPPSPAAPNTPAATRTIDLHPATKLGFLSPKKKSFPRMFTNR